LVQTVHPDGSLTRTVYDINNRPIVSQSEYMPTVQSSAGELEVSDSGGTRTVYDGFGRVHFTETLLKVLIAIQLFLATFANAERTSREQIDDAGRRRMTQDVIPNSSSTTLQRDFRHGYDSGGRLATESAYSSLNAPSTTAAGAAVSYTVNPFGNRTKRDIAINAAQDPGYSGKIGAVATYSYDNQDKLTAYTGNSTFSWDSGGNVVNTGTGYTYTHDRRNRLRQSTGPTVTASMAYDPTGIRVKKTVGTTTTLYLVDSMNPTGYAHVLCEYQYTGTGTPSIQRSYTYGLHLISDKQGTTRQYYSVDALGTTRFLTSSGATASLSASISAQFHYDAFGTLLGPGTDTSTPYLYTGEQWDRDVGAYYLRARWYSVGLGRFLERDSYEGDDADPISRNRYLYASANPVNNVDPTGKYSTTEISTTIGSIANVYSRVSTVVTHVRRFQNMYNLIQEFDAIREAFSGDLGGFLKVGLRESRRTFANLTVEAIIDNLNENKGRILGSMVREWPMKIALRRKRVEAVGVYLPNPLPSPLVPIPLLSSGGGGRYSTVPTYLLFGGGGSHAAGRVVGIGVRLGPNQSDWQQVWRMDFHDPHKDTSDVDYWVSGAFHHHVSRASTAPPSYQ
jgi:RHS repeat-associated protein